MIKRSLRLFFLFNYPSFLDFEGNLKCSQSWLMSIFFGQCNWIKLEKFKITKHLIMINKCCNSKGTLLTMLKVRVYSIALRCGTNITTIFYLHCNTNMSGPLLWHRFCRNLRHRQYRPFHKLDFFIQLNFTFVAKTLPIIHQLRVVDYRPQRWNNCDAVSLLWHQTQSALSKCRLRELFLDGHTSLSA